MKKLTLLILLLASFTTYAQITVSVNGNNVGNGGTYNLGNQNGSLNFLSVNISNTGGDGVSIVDDNGDAHLIDLTGNASTECSVNEGTISSGINAGQNKSVNITYTPVSSGSKTIHVSFRVIETTSYTFAFDITANMTISPVTTSVNGNSVINGGSYSLGNQTGSVNNLTVLINNTGANSLSIVDDNGDAHLVDLTGNAATECSVNEGTLSSGINAGQSKSFTITYTPVTSGNKTIHVAFRIIENTSYTFEFDITTNMTVSSTLTGSSSSIFLAPNPFSDRSILQITDQDHDQYEIEVSNLSGKIVETQVGLTGQNNIAIGKDLPAGIYFVAIKSSAGITMQKIVKE